MATKKRFFAVKIFLFFIAALIVLLCLFITVITVNYKAVFRYFFERDLQINKIELIPEGPGVTLHGISLATLDGDKLLTAESATVLLDLPRTLSLRPTLKSLTITKPETFINRKNTSYTLPPYVKTVVHMGKFRLPFSLNEVTIQQGMLYLRENGKASPFITDIEIALPSINSELDKIKPEISGKLNGKQFYFAGESVFGDHGEMKNVFHISLKGLDLVADKLIIPVIPGFVLERGIIDINGTFTYTIDRKKHATATISGTLKAAHLYVSSVEGVRIIENITGNVSVEEYDITHENLLINTLTIENGRFIFPKTPPQKSSFKAAIRHLVVNQLEALNDTLTLRNINGHLDMIDNDREKHDFTLQCALGETGTVQCSGTISNGELLLNSINLRNINPYSLSMVKKVEGIDALTLEQFTGSGYFAKGATRLSGTLRLKNVLFAKENISGSIESLGINIAEYDSDKNYAALSSISVDNGEVHYKTDNYSNINLTITAEGKPAAIPLAEKKEFNNTLLIPLLEFTNQSPLRPYTVKAVNGRMELKLSMNEKETIGSGTITTDTITLVSGGTLFGKLNGVTVHADKITTAPLRINCSSVAADYLYARTDITREMSIIFAGIIDVSTLNKKDKESEFIHVGSLSVKDGALSLYDTHLDKPLYFDFSKIEVALTNFPSYIYPSGSIHIGGMVDSVNPFELNATVSKTFTEGKFTAKDILLFRLSPYTEYYIKHKISDGRLSLSIPFTSDSAKTSLTVKIDMKKPVLEKTSLLFPINFVTIFRTLEERDGSVQMELPVEIKKNKTKVDYFAVVFDVMKNTVRLAAEKFLNPLPDKIVYDNIYSILSFKGGSSEPETEDFLSTAMQGKIADKRSIFTITGYVEKASDTEYLKRTILKKLVKRYDEGNTKETYKHILATEYTTDSDETSDEADLASLLLSKISVRQEDYYALAYSRATEAASLLTEKYGIAQKRIFIADDDLFSNPYISGISNSIAIIRTGHITQ